MSRSVRRSLARDRRGVAAIEFALAAPVLILAIAGLLELGNVAIQMQRVSQSALLIADNAGRLGNMGMRGPEKVTERQINDALSSANVQNPGLRLKERGRIILTSLERNPDGGQWLHWQRCVGALPHRSSWGVENDGAHGGTVAGMGPADGQIAAFDNHPIMFVEIAYKVETLVFPGLAPTEPIIETAAMPVRVDRNTSEVVGNVADKAKCD